ncbi:hypothetical protein BD779DRAFT_1608274 [Infundibulicybe gibba]|nr:hypothetical protein BD779DRAFT_1608274 [Infundibulicybe gibba]
MCITHSFLGLTRTMLALVLPERGLASTVQNAKSFHIPVIDFARFRTARSSSEKKQTANEIVSAFKESGFIYLGGHGIPGSVVNEAFQKSAEFFRMPVAIKACTSPTLQPRFHDLAWEDPRSNRGYVKIGRERVTQSSDPAEIASLRTKAPDFKESMEIGRDWESEWKNQWPQETDAPHFKRTMLDFYQTCHNLHVHVMRSIALGLGLEEQFFDRKIDEQCHNLRLLSYPPIKRSILEGDGQARAGAHSDYGTLTLLFQDSVGGLEVQNPHTGSFIPATPIPGTIVVNVGDLLARWSNDLLRSTLHPNQHDRINHPSSPVHCVFCNPNFSAEVSCLPNCGTEAKYPPINTETYIVGRLAATYT